MDFDWRVLVVLGPIAIALSWAVFNIGQAALGQIQNYLNRET
jgi:photosystem II PsbY protein